MELSTDLLKRTTKSLVSLVSTQLKGRMKVSEVASLILTIQIEPFFLFTYTKSVVEAASFEGLLSVPSFNK